VPSREVRYIITGNAAGGVRAFKQTEDAALGAGQRLEATGAKLTKVGAGMESFGRKMVGLSVPLLAVGGYSVKMALDFQKSMTEVRTQTGATGKEVGYFSRELLKMGNTGFDGTELAKGLFRVSSDGFKGAEALRVLRAAAGGAAVSGADLEQTTNALGGVLRTHLKDVHGAASAMGILNSIVGLGKFRFEELNAALSSGFLVSAKRTGIGLSEIGNALDALARKGVPPEEEATRLQKTLIQFSAVTGVAKKALHSIGVGQFQLAEDMKKHGLIYALQDLHNHLGRIDQYKGNAVIAEAFGRSKGAGNVGALLESLPEMEKISKERAKYGTLQHELAITEQKDYFKIKAGIAQLKNTLIQLGSSLLPVVVPAFKKLAGWLESTANWFRKLPKPIKDVAFGFTVFLAVGGPMLIFFGKLIGTVGSTISLLGKLATALSVGTEAGAAASGLEIFGAALAGIAAFAAPLLIVVGALEAINRLEGAKHSIFTKQGQHESLRHASNTRAQAGSPIATGLSLLTGGGGSSGRKGAPRGSLQGELESLGYKTTGNGFNAPMSLQQAIRNALMREPEHNGRLAPVVEEHHHHIYIDGKQVAVTVAHHIRNTPSIAKPVAEGVTKSAQFKAAH
jgi:TP901 family phage tail tape measure protein